MGYKIDYNELSIRVVKLLFEGAAVGLVALILPGKNKLSLTEVFAIALTAACVLAILDLLAPALSDGARQGIGMGSGFRMVGFPML